MPGQPPPLRARLLRARTRDGRLLADVQMLAGQVRRSVEILQPFGLSAAPLPGAELLVFAAAGAPDQLVALAGDSGALRATGLAPGDLALRDTRGATLRLDGDGVLLDAAGLRATVRGASEVVVQAPVVRLGGPGATTPVRLASGAAATKVFAE